MIHSLLGPLRVLTILSLCFFILFRTVLAYLWPIVGRATVVAKREVLYMFPFGLASWLWGTLFIDRRNQSSAKTAINKESKAINEKQVRFFFNYSLIEINLILNFSGKNPILPWGNPRRRGQSTSVQKGFLPRGYRVSRDSSTRRDLQVSLSELQGENFQ